MKILVLATDYPNKTNNATLYYIHARNLYYKENGVEVTVLNFLAKENYIFDDINVITKETYENKYKNDKFDLLVAHAPNLRNHYKFLKLYEKKFPKIVFFFHGHEVLMTRKVYPKPYPFMEQKLKLRKYIQNFYDRYKLKTWRKYYSKLAYKSYFVFVSKWMYDEFMKWTEIDKDTIAGRYSITYNCIGSNYEKESYDNSIEKEYDFITIRSVIDGSKYCVDLICELAENNPKSSFLLVGKGEFFNHYRKPDNLFWINNYLFHDQIIEMLNKAKCALMPTRADAQGLMTCEMATFGIPVITSDIPVCHEIFEGFENVAFIKNGNSNVDLEKIVNSLYLNKPYKKNEKYFNDNTSREELKMFKELIN
ncbi:glycosyltransferase [Cytobacillus gottheilii]|uniref:Glycosyltransferase family 4 protein n=1 Tax=Cytobacillus gottheilii TaxID=859144 RepID=A0ABX8FCL9_9BACI|nr:glycosyltransferase [Cytobacillus gottheilii]QVY61292.1 glycosyltransferase family 4 protein [Cytobacillus gottheilii]